MIGRIDICVNEHLKRMFAVSLKVCNAVSLSRFSCCELVAVEIFAGFVFLTQGECYSMWFHCLQEEAVFFHSCFMTQSLKEKKSLWGGTILFYCLHLPSKGSM